MFVIDDRQRIVEWSDGATVTLGIPAKAAVGQPCYELVRGHDPFGRAVCGSPCPASKALQSDRLTARSTLLMDQEGEGTRRFICELVALPGLPGGAVVTLHEPRQESPPTTAPPFGISAADTAHDLAALATLSTSLSLDRPDQSVDRALEWLCQATEAEAAELFLAEAVGSDMLLAGYQGPFRNAFSQITRFPVGEGFPGLVLATQKPIVTRSLPEDNRYLRTRVKERGFRSYVCVPLFQGSDGILGSLHVAARRPDLDTERVLRILTWASHPISTIVEVGRLQTRLAIMAGSGGGDGSGRGAGL